MWAGSTLINCTVTAPLCQANPDQITKHSMLQVRAATCQVPCSQAGQGAVGMTRWLAEVLGATNLVLVSGSGSPYGACMA
jgi:hypothetical protein